MTLPVAFNKLSAANLAAQSAEQLSLAAVPILAVLLLKAGPAEIGLLGIAQTLPFLLLSIPLGLATDRYSRRHIMLIAEFLRAASLLGLLLVVLLGWTSLVWLGLLGFVGATGTVAFSVAAPATVQSLVERSDLPKANSRLELARSTAYALGPTLAGALVAWAGASSAFVLGAILSVIALIMLSALPVLVPTAKEGKGRNVFQDLKEGALFVWNQAYLRPILLTSVVWNLAWFVLQAAYVPYALRTLGMSTQTLGFTLGAQGLGMVIGALFATKVMSRLNSGHTIIIGPLFSLVASTLMACTLLWPSAWLAGFAFFLFGVGPIIWTVSTMTLRQRITAPEILGRVSSIFLTANMGARPIGAALGAALGGAIGAIGGSAGTTAAANASGEVVCLLVSVALFAVQFVAIVWSPVRSLKV